MAISSVLCSSIHPTFPSSVATLRFRSPVQESQIISRCLKGDDNGRKAVKPSATTYTPKRFFCHAVHMESGQSGEPEKTSFQDLINKAQRIWDSSPQPIKEFPWNRAFENFIQLVLDLILSVVKYLYAPVLAISSVSEMSYCAHQRKLSLVPFPLLIGIVAAGSLQDTAMELSPRLKEAEVPWHLIAIVICFSLIKLPGPYYPFWGRIFIPHFANGVLWRTLWSLFFWYRKPRIAVGNPLKHNEI